MWSGVLTTEGTEDTERPRFRVAELLLEEECYAIRGCIFEVYREMGSGFLESVYQECLEREFVLRGIPFESQKRLDLTYKGQGLSQTYTPDLVCFGKISVELKSARGLLPEHKAQVLNYLKATGFRVGLLVNFGAHPKATVERLVL